MIEEVVVEPDTGISPQDQIEAAREKLGGLETVEITADNLVDAHRQLGQLFGEKIRAGSETPPDTEWMRKLLITMKEKAKSNEGVKQYLDCLAAWAEGAGVTLEMALWRQNDNVGCQTLMLFKNGQVKVLHTEEELPGVVDKPRLVKFLIGEETINFFAYPHLLPGATFGWKEKGGEIYFQAVDFLTLETGDKSDLLANMAAWLGLMAGDYDGFERMIDKCGGFVDGYAVNLVELKDGKSRAKEVVFGHKGQKTTELNQGKSHLFQVNVLNEPIEGIREDLAARKRQKYINRRERMEEILTRMGENQEWGLDDLMKLAAFRVGGVWAMANRDVLAVFAGVFSEDGFSYKINPGPATKEKKGKTV